MHDDGAEQNSGNNVKRGKSDVTYPCPCTLTFLASPPPPPTLLISDFAATPVVQRGGSFTSSRAHTGNIEVGRGRQGENSIDVFSMRLKINLSPSRVLYLLSRLDCDPTRHSARCFTRMETNYVFSGRFSSVKASIDGGERVAINTWQPVCDRQLDRSSRLATSGDR